uniref:Uncharacterized protein n=1 Tax=Eutreptiella gymnastica TaxID=73025 RepID=A0A7S1IXU9_9EUGL|mmetsp:Transcript_51810/g.92419  ORF Transcript_51810/g.92419 Transcript_51810/m.92419 type:complete len:102 (+) Transcript_51810:354-659(+)
MLVQLCLVCSRGVGQFRLYLSYCCRSGISKSVVGTKLFQTFGLQYFITVAMAVTMVAKNGQNEPMMVPAGPQNHAKMSLWSTPSRCNMLLICGKQGADEKF